MYEAGDIIDEATRRVAPEVIERDDVQESLQYLFGWLDRLTDWIDPDSDGYREELYEARTDGAYELRHKVEEMLEEALYRQRMFGIVVDVENLLGQVRSIDWRE